MNHRLLLLAALGFALPATAAFAECAQDIAKFQKLLDSDVKVGHLNKGVYQKASADLAAAGTLCTTGKDAAASAAVRATRTRYGYP